jgi:formate-dependent nitrite reductase membrane component NrfD
MNFPPEYQKPPQSLWDWIINVFITKIPIIGIIMLIVWATDKTTEQNKANWAKAELIVTLIALVIGLLIMAIVGFGFFMNFTDKIDWNSID